MIEIYCGIYLITNIRTGEHYIGQSVNVLGRWNGHRTALRSGTGAQGLQESFDRHGEAAFRLSIIEVCGPDDLDARELHWILHFKPGLNTKIPDWTAANPLPLRRRDVRQRQAAKLAAVAAEPRCGCGGRKIKGQRYCGRCRLRAIGEMRRSGYLTPIYGTNRPRQSCSHAKDFS